MRREALIEVKGRSKSHRLYFVNEPRKDLPSDLIGLVKLDLVKEKTILNYKKALKEIGNKFHEEVISKSWGGIEKEVEDLEETLKANDTILNQELRRQIVETRNFEVLGRKMGDSRNPTQPVQTSLQQSIFRAFGK